MVSRYSRHWRMIAKWCVLAFLVTGVISTGAAIAEDLPAANPAAASESSKIAYAKAALLANTDAVEAGKPFKVGVQMVMQPGWHTYYKESGQAGMPTRITWTLPPGFTVGELEWEQPHKFVDAGITTYGYADKTLIAATVTPPKDLKDGTAVDIAAKVKWLACKDMCVPGKAELTLNLKVGPAKAVNEQDFAKVGFAGSVTSLTAESHEQGGAAGSTSKKSILDQDIHVSGQSQEQPNLLGYLGLAFIGGFILNFMPCVLPVISIKVLSFMQQAGEDPKRVFQLGMTFTAGIVVSFLALGLMVIGIQSAGQQIGWGFQFQFPLFLLAMSSVVLVFALSLFGLVYFQVSAGQDKIDKLASKEGFVGTFFKGVLATTLSTPCTAPFLGTALGFAFAQPSWVILLIFFTIAAGMAFPYVLLTAQPAWMKYLPKPGVWMEKFKESMGFLLLATVVWLVWVLGQQVGINAAMAATGFLVALSFATWLIGRFVDLTATGQRKAVVYSIAGLTMVLAYYFLLRPFPDLLSTNPTAPRMVQLVSDTVKSGEELNWEPFSIAKLDEEIAAKKTVLIDFTADWCLTCKVNENTVLNTKPVIDKIKENNIVTLRADWTRQDPQISEILRKFGRSGVPLYVIFPASKTTEPIVLPEVITQQIVLDKLNEALK